MKSNPAYKVGLLHTPPNRSRLLVGLIAALILIVGISFALRWNPMKSWGRSVETNRWAGMSETALVEKFGPPTRTINGYQSVGLLAPRTQPAVPVKTCVYERRGGYLYLWYQLSAGQWTCFESLWFDHNVRF